MVSSLRAPLGDERWASYDGDISVRRPGPGLMLVSLRGHMSVNAAGFLRAALGRTLDRSARVNVFSDMEEVSGYDAPCRAEATKLFAELRERGGTLTVLVRSRLAAAGLRVASVALGVSIRVHTDRRSFEDALTIEAARAPLSGLRVFLD